MRTGRHVVHNLHVHLVFVTKYRRKAFSDAMLTRREVCTDFEAELKQFNAELDHIHLLVRHPPKGICGAGTSGLAPTSPAHAAEHR